MPERNRVQPLSQDGSAPLAVATSLQLFNKVDLQTVMKAGRWSSGGTFTSFYLRDLCPQADSLRRSGPVVISAYVDQDQW